MNQNSIDLLKLTFAMDTQKLGIDISFWLILIIILLSLVPIIFKLRKLRKFKLVSLEIAFGNIGKVELSPNIEDIQIAHKIWTQLVTRKAAIPIDPENDVIVEVYDSWYSVFIEIRKLIGNIPATLLKKNKSTKKLVHIAISTLNDGLRPHLTKWQAKFPSWYDANKDELKKISPQELQIKYPLFQDLIKDMKRINQQMIEYAKELKKLIDD